MTKAEHIIHPIAPVYDADSRILILGTLPSPASRAFGFYYGHKQNLFWPLLAGLFNEQIPADIAERRAFALKHHIALFDVLKEGDIVGASDSSIKNAVVNDFAPIFETANIQAVFCTGKTALKYYNAFAFPKTQKEAIYLPSTSPANRAAQSKPEFMAAWRQIVDYIS